MIALSSTGELVAALHRARDISLSAYLLPPGRILDALTEAAAAGAHVRVRLEGFIYKDDGTVTQDNQRAIDRLRGAGADVEFVHADARAGDAMLHAKAAIVDGTVFLDDRNWPSGRANTIVRDDTKADVTMVRDAMDGREDPATPSFSIAKRESLASEAGVLRASEKGDDVIVESESFGSGNSVCAAIEELARRGAHVRVLIGDRSLEGNANEQASIEQLERDGVEVRVSDVSEKFAVVNGATGWIGSANATIALNCPDQLDWGARTAAAPLLDHLDRAFEERWATASRVKIGAER